MKYRKKNILRKNIQDIKSKLTITNSMVQMQFMVVLLVVRCREMGNEAYMETSLLQLLMYTVSPAVYEIIYEALGTHVMHESMYKKHASTDLTEK
jgi:hypothetical protein